MNMNISPIANDMLEAINNYKEASCKTNYRFELEEYIRLKQEAEALIRHLDLIMDYEIRKESK